MRPPPDWTTLIGAFSAPSELNTDRRRSLLVDALGLGVTITADSAGCSVTELSDAGFHTPAASNELAMELDVAQYAAGDGPCVAACRDNSAHAVRVMDAEPGYAGFTAVALSRGVHSSLSLPLPEVRRPSALNLYAMSPAAFDDPRAQRVAGLLARCVGMLLTENGNTVEGGPSGLSAARARQGVVRQAQQRLGAERGMTPDQALTWMMHRSREEHCSIFTIVGEVLHGEGTAPAVEGEDL